MSEINWDLGYEEWLHKVKPGQCVHCYNSDKFDPDSVENTIENYIDLYFTKADRDLIAFIGTNVLWKYEIRRQYNSPLYEIRLKNAENGHELIVRGDTIGTYKWPMALLRTKTLGADKELTYSNLKKINGLDLTQLNFCSCEKNALYNNHGIASFFIIPKPNCGSINTARARYHYFDNFFVFLDIIKNYCIKGYVKTESWKKLFEETDDYWNLYKGEDGFDNYIKSMAFEPFITNIPKELYTSELKWDVEVFNLYLSTLNECINRRKIILQNRVN